MQFEDTESINFCTNDTFTPVHDYDSTSEDSESPKTSPTLNYVAPHNSLFNLTLQEQLWGEEDDLKTSLVVIGHAK